MLPVEICQLSPFVLRRCKETSGFGDSQEKRASGRREMGINCHRAGSETVAQLGTLVNKKLSIRGGGQNTYHPLGQLSAERFYAKEM